MTKAANLAALGTSSGTSVLVSGTSVATTSGTSIDFTSIPSWVKRITVLFNGVSTSSTSLVQVQIGSGSVATTGYLSYCAYISPSSSTSNSSTGFLINAGGPAGGSTFNGALVIYLTNTSYLWTSSYAGATLASGTNFANVGGGNKTLSGVIDRVRITTLNGTDTFTAGTINILYE
jgi:hypothetical protein